MDRYILVETAPREQLSILRCVNKRATPWPKTTHSMASHPGDAEEIRAHCPRTISSLTTGLRTSDRFCVNQSPSLPKAPAWGRAKTPTCPKLRPGLEPKLRPAQRSGLSKNQSSNQTRRHSLCKNPSLPYGIDAIFRALQIGLNFSASEGESRIYPSR